jgi:hypothetical protein
MSKSLFRCKASLGWLIRFLLTQFQQLIFPSESAEYRLWRDEFMWTRLGFCLWGAIPLWFCATANDLYYWFHLPQATEVLREIKPIALKWLSASLIIGHKLRKRANCQGGMSKIGKIGAQAISKKELRHPLNPHE